MPNTYKHFTNRGCKFYPCHDIDNINCLFCYCPLFSLTCPGKYDIINEKKDCSTCTIPHGKNSWKIMQKYIKKGEEWNGQL